MKKKISKIATITSAIILTAGTLMACGTTKDTAAENVETESAAVTDAQSVEATKEDTLSGSISMAGSTSMEKLANAVAESFMAAQNGKPTAPAGTEERN